MQEQFIERGFNLFLSNSLNNILQDKNVSPFFNQATFKTYKNPVNPLI